MTDNHSRFFSIDHVGYHLPPLSLPRRINERQRLPSFRELNDIILKSRYPPPHQLTKKRLIVDSPTKRSSKQQKINKQTKAHNHDQIIKPKYQCQSCHSTETPEWRKGPLGTLHGPRTLCNACGLIWIKLRKNNQVM